MGVNLQKGQKIDLTKGNSGLRSIMVGLGWDEAERTGGLLGMFKSAPQAIDCDASAILCDESGHATELVYYGNLRDKSSAVVHQGDNLTGEGEGDDEEIFVDLASLPQSVGKIVFVVNIYEAQPRKQHFGMIKNAFIRLVDSAKNSEICRYNLSENYDGMTGLVVGEIYRYQGEWKFSAVGAPVKEASRVDSLVAMYR
ncbi:MAG: TerD family protein [Synergistaceae bacterium]|jgi:stress response protein SCP2|nr:TerD family protein [Synergistaceae bacterium]